MDEKEKTIRKIAKLLRKETIEDFCSCEVIADMIYEMLFGSEEKEIVNISKDVFNVLYHIFLDDLRAGYEGFDEFMVLLNSKYKKYIDIDFDYDTFLMFLSKKG